jgi:hypothetical protein
VERGRERGSGERESSGGAALTRGRGCLFDGLVSFNHPQGTNRLIDLVTPLVTLFGSLGTKRGTIQTGPEPEPEPEPEQRGS